MTTSLLTNFTLPLSLLLVFAACASDDSSDTTDTNPTAGTTGATTTGDDPSTSGEATTSDDSTTSTSSTSTADPSTSSTGGETTGAPAMAMIRVIHLSPDAPAVDVYANDGADPVVEGLAVKNSTDYLEVPAGTYTFSIAPAGTSLGDAVFTTPALDLAADTMYSAVAVGKLAPGDGDGGFDVVALVDSTEGLAEGSVRLQVLHAAAAAPFAQVDVWEVSDPNNPAALIEDFDFKASGSLDVPSVPLMIGLDVDNDGVPDAVFDVPSLPPDSLVDVAAFSDAGDVPSLQAVVAAGATTQLDPK